MAVAMRIAYREFLPRSKKLSSSPTGTPSTARRSTTNDDEAGGIPDGNLRGLFVGIHQTMNLWKLADFTMRQPDD
jgi:hypothetical protein